LWIEHLNTMTELREGIGLRGYGQRDPLIEYKQEAFVLFQELIKAIENRVIDILTKIEIRPAQTQSQDNLVSPRADETRQNISLQGAQVQSGFSNQSVPAPESDPSSTNNNNGVSVTVRQTSDNSGESSNQTVHRAAKKVGRNDPCPCGSGKKYKKCCGS